MISRTISRILLVVCLLVYFSNLRAQVIFEAEDAFISAGNPDTEHAGYTGDGFVDTENELGVYVEWSFNVLKDYTDTLAFRYALGKDEHRTMQVVVNDELIDTIDFDNTNEFTNYIYKYTVGTLNEGNNTVRLVSINAEGAPNLDHLMLKLDTNVYFHLNMDLLGEGTVTITPEADSFLYGTRVKLNPVAETGNAFINWTGDITGSKAPYTFTVDNDYTFQANFRTTQLAFPGAEGFAQNISGGRGGIVVEVTNLNDNGTGSLRAAVQLNATRTVVFRVAGTIELESNLNISQDNITIAGQTAPGGGITLSGYPLKINADNVIIRFIRSRLGDANAIEDDAMNGREHNGILLDHCTMSWSVDETGSFYDNTNFTMQYCLLSESLYESVHDKGRHGYGGIWGGKNATFHHNLLAHHTSRNPRFCGSRYSNQPDLEMIDFRNNVIYNWGSNSVYGAEGGSYNIVNNYYKYGPATSQSVRSRIIAPNDDNGENNQPAGVWGEFFVDGNYVWGYDAVTENNWIGVHTNNNAEIRTDTPFPADTVTTHSAEIAFEHVMAQVGTVLPTRDEIDRRIIREALTGTATFGGVYGEGEGIIDTPSDVGGYPVLEAGTPPVDSDHDGMPDSWETARGLNSSDASDRNGDDDSDGFTNLEEYLNELVANHTYILRPLHFTMTSYNEQGINLEWDAEEDATHYLLERRLGDAGEFSQIADLSSSETSYSDQVVADAGNHYYRLRAANDSDTSYYSEELVAEFSVGLNNQEEQAFNNFRIAPNPFINQLSMSITLPQQQNVNIFLLDITGQKISNLYSGEMHAGSHELMLDMPDLNSGLYLLAIEAEGQRHFQKLIKE